MKIFNVSGYSSVLLASVLLTAIALPTPRAMAIEVDEVTIEKVLGNTAIEPSSSLNSVQQQFENALNGPQPKFSINGASSAPVVPPISISAQNFSYFGASTLASPLGFNNTKAFQGCLSDQYGLLGTNVDGPVQPPLAQALPIVGLAASNISPNLNDAAIARLKSVNVKIRFAFLGNSQGARMRLALRNVNTNEVKQFGDFRVNGGTCQTFSKNVVTGFQKPGVYRLEVRLVNNPFRIDPANPNSPLTSEVAVAGFNATTITVVRK